MSGLSNQNDLTPRVAVSWNTKDFRRLKPRPALTGARPDRLSSEPEPHAAPLENRSKDRQKNDA